MSNWNGILIIDQIQLLDSSGNILWHDSNIKNMLHQEGEQFLLKAAFTGGAVSTVIPDNYYLGLDARSVVLAADTMDDVVGEPSTGGYARQTITSSGDFSVNFDGNHYSAQSPIVAFRSTTLAWGPVSNLFLTNKNDSSGYLISTAILSSPITLAVGDNVTMRISMRLAGC